MPANRIENILQTVAQRVPHLIAADRFYATLYDATKSELTFPLVWEKGEILPANCVPWLPRSFDGERWLPDRVIERGEILLFENDFAIDTEAAGLRAWPDERSLQSWLGVPMIVGEQVIGALVVEHGNKASAFGEEGMRVLSTIARQTALALDNVRLYDLWIREQEKIIAMEKFSVMSQVAGEFAHRMSNLVGTIPVRINLAKAKLNPNDPRDAEVIKQLEKIYADSQQLLQAAQQIKESTATRAPESVNINEIVNIVIRRAVASLPGIESRVTVLSDNLDPNLPEIQVERSELLDTLTNIIKNGLDAMPDGGTLTVKTHLGRLANNDCIEVAVMDTGKGIPPENLSKIFDLFFTTKPGGLGFGLWKDKVYIQRIGGDIEVHSKVLEGTTFVIKIPIDNRGEHS
jgi:signal transduction histidine kinase